MLRTETLFPFFEMKIPSFDEMLYSDCDSKLSLKVHQIKSGKSPLVIVHIAETVSSKFTSSSPKVNGTI